MRELNDCDALHARTRQRFDLLFLGHQQRRRFVGPKDARRMRLEGHRCRRAATLPRAPTHTVDDLHVPTMKPIEVSERQHGVVPAGRRIIGKVGNHQSAIAIRNQQSLNQHSAIRISNVRVQR